MTTFNVATIGSVDFGDDDDGYWSAPAVLGEASVDVDFNTDGAPMTQALLARVEQFVAELPRFDALARAAIAADFAAGDESSSRLYLEHHLAELDVADRVECFGTEAVDIGADQLLAAIGLHRVGLYPEKTQQVAVFDYMLAGEISDYLLSVEFDVNGRVLGVSMES